MMTINPFALIRPLVLIAFLLILIASQLFWLRQLRHWGKSLIANQRLRRCLAAAAVTLLILLFAYNLRGLLPRAAVAWSARNPGATHLTPEAALLQAPFCWWIFGSVLSFAMVILFSVFDRLARAGLWTYRRLIYVGTGCRAPASRGTWRVDLSRFNREARRYASPDQHSPYGGRPPAGRLGRPPQQLARRRFLQRTAVAASAAPFVAGAYGLFYGRLNLETAHRQIRLRRCPKAFEGFRIAQLSDLHIGPFMSSEEIRRYVDIANRLKPDLVVLTGDYITWDPTTQGAAVEALAGLRAPFGTFGCLGNHELWTRTEDSITSLFAAQGIRILRQECVPIQVQNEALNLIGVDFQTRSRSRMRRRIIGLVNTYLEAVEELVLPGTLNILLSHNPNTFDRAAELGIDLSLAGHTHGGQVVLEFVHPDLSPGRLITPYVQGWFEKRDAQLYVNRGIGTIGIPIRLNARPEITLFELTREA